MSKDYTVTSNGGRVTIPGWMIPGIVRALGKSAESIEAAVKADAAAAGEPVGLRAQVVADLRDVAAERRRICDVLAPHSVVD